MQLTITKRSYRLDISDEQFLKLSRHEDSNWREKTLSAKLDEVRGVSRTEYNGHFGASIFFDIDTDEDSAELRKEIRKIVRDHLDDIY